jgi:hypothetical protein
MQPYTIENVDADAAPATDAWAAFLSARFSQKKELYQRLADHEKDIVRKELRRIRYLRTYFEEHQLSANDSSSLTTLLDRSLSTWKDHASRRCKDELHRCEVGIARTSGYRQQEFNKQRLTLEQVQQWRTPEYAHIQRSAAPESYIPGLDDMDHSLDDDPAKPDYGYNGWVVSLRKNLGGVTLEQNFCHGEFAHQKISMQRLLYDKEHTPLKRSADKTQLRYFHFQANNIKWVEVGNPCLLCRC